MRNQLFEDIGNCTICDIASELKAFHRGSTDPDIVFIGEAAGAKEIKIGQPFVGPSGKRLDRWIERNVSAPYAITNVVRCKPPDNRRPTDMEIYNCRKWLEKQIRHYAPKTIIPLGKTAYEAALGPLGKDAYMPLTFRVYTKNTFKSRAIVYPIPHPRWYISHGREIPDLDGQTKKLLHL